MSLIKPRTRGKRLVRHRTRLDHLSNAFIKLLGPDRSQTRACAIDMDTAVSLSTTFSASSSEQLLLRRRRRPHTPPDTRSASSSRGT